MNLFHYISIIGNFRAKSGNISYVPPKPDKHINDLPAQASPRKAHVVIPDSTIVEGKSNTQQGGKWKRVKAEVETRYIIPLSHSRAKLRN